MGFDFAHKIKSITNGHMVVKDTLTKIGRRVNLEKPALKPRPVRPGEI
jgi:hypothetical protein